MQGEETNTRPPVTLTEPASEPLTPGKVPQVKGQDDDPDELFLNAVAEIDTQPLVKPKRVRAITLADVLQTMFCVSLLCVGCFGIVWQAITYPHTLVILFASEKPAHITVTLALQTRTLAPVTVTRTAIAPTTGKGHQDARAAAGILTFYNGNFSPQSIPVGTVFTCSDGVKVATSEAVTVPAAQPPQFAIASVSASAVSTGSKTNIAAGDINLALSSDLLVKNLAAFTGGRDARDFQAVAQRDLNGLTSTLQQTLTQAIPQAFTLRKGEAVFPTTCTFTATADHGIGEEATTVTVKASDTCKGIAYSKDELTHKTTAAFTATRPGTQYQLVDTIQTGIITVSPFTVHINGLWAYIFTKDYEQSLAEHIAGDTPAKAKAYLLSTGVIASASVPSVLPPAMYINFLVLAG